MKKTFRLLITLLACAVVTIACSEKAEEPAAVEEVASVEEAAAVEEATADEATKLTVIEKIDIAAAPEAVWESAKNFGELHVWHPGVESSTNTDGNNIGSVRVLDLGGPTITEELVAFDDENKSFTYKINEVDPAVLPVKDYISSFSVEDNGQGGSSITWDGSFNLVGTPKPEDIQAGVSGIYRGGIENLKSTLEAD
ncbi:MAG: hypothetical protein A6F71_07580 [Cycloclasticus sp. symbiont of Poecilosclerida sp. M]|nr:MAG: hypothetical protein A6F71_07580 [Cycloclasticus sp. symbiont of Poecilosclerida sp. M]